MTTMVNQTTPGAASNSRVAGQGPLSQEVARTHPTARTGVRLAVRWDRDLRYPEADDYFSPSDDFPEYRMQHLAKRKNLVYAAVRDCFAMADLDGEHYGSSEWNPLGEYVRPGNKVFVLCNFVKHDDRAQGALRFSAKCTHGSVLRAVLDYVLLALNGVGTVRFGNAPIQSCNWTQVLADTGAAQVNEFYHRVCPQRDSVCALDLRRHVVRQDKFGARRVELHAQDDDCVEVDLGQESLLDYFYQPSRTAPRLRVLDYDPRRIERCHERGRHVYILHRAILESDVIISLPKLKTHEKVGMTGGIKGCVGSVAHKDCLAHHRFGSPKSGGDEFPDRLRLLEPLSALHDFANARSGGLVRDWAQGLDVLARKVLRRFTRSFGGSWSGNDTCWRMALDLARIVAYADRDAVLHEEPQRKHIMLTDGVVAGERNGPLSPDPIRFGYVAFADQIALGDYLNCEAMGFAPERLPIVHQAFQPHRYPLGSGSELSSTVILNGSRVGLRDLPRMFTQPFAPPLGWRASLSRTQAPQ